MVTNDGYWLMGIEKSRKIYIFKFNGKYELYQAPIQMDDDYEITSGFISGNLLFIGKENGKVFLYKYKDNKYLFDQTLADVGKPIFSISATNDNSRIAFGT